MLIDPQLLRSFVSVAELRSVSRAAEAVHLTQSAVSAQIKRLEELLGCRVFERTTRTLALTTHGQALLGYARGILTLNDQAILRLRSDKRAGELVRVGCAEGLPADWLFGTLARYREQHPEVQVEVTGGISLTLFDLAQSRSLDIVVGARCDGTSTGELLWSEPLVWAFPERCFLNPDEPLPIALMAEPCPFRDAALLALASHRRKWRVVLAAQSCSALLHAVSSGFAVTPLTPSIMPAGLQAVPTGDILPTLPKAEFFLRMREGRLGEGASELATELRRACHRWLGSLQAGGISL